MADVWLDSRTVVLAVLFAVSPLIAAALLSAVETGAFAAAALADTALSPLWDGWQGSAKYAVRMVNAFLICLGAVATAGLRERRERRLTRVTAIARAAQQAVLPDLPNRMGQVTLGVRYRSATHEALIGGDLFDAVRLDDRVRIVVGDVRGKGLEAVGHAARTIRAFRQFGSSKPDLVAVATSMSAYLAPFLAAEDFVTAMLVEVRDDSTVTIVGCGHPPPYLLQGDQVELLPAAETPPLGLAEPLGLLPAYEAQSLTIGGSDRLLLYTDGLIETRNESGEEFEPSQIARYMCGSDPETALDTLLTALADHAAPRGLSDDLALMLIEFDGSSLAVAAEHDHSSAHQ